MGNYKIKFNPFTGNLQWVLDENMVFNLDWQESVLDNDLTAPPVSPTIGDRYIVASVATGAWVGLENEVVEYTASGWVSTTLTEGATVEVEDENIVFYWNGSSWVRFDSIFDHNQITGQQGGTTDEYYHLTSSEYTELNAWLDDVTLGASGSLTLPTGENFTVGTVQWTSALTDKLNADSAEDGATNAIVTLTQETNFETAYSHSQTITGNPHSIDLTDLTTYDHVNLQNLQGGMANQYYHLTSSEYTELSQWLDSVVLDSAGSVNFGASSLTVNSIEIVGADGEVNKAAVEDSGTWDTAYSHSQIVTGNPHVIDITDLTTYAHNSLTSPQGGTSNEYYHLTSTEYTELSEWLDNVVLDSAGAVTFGADIDFGDFDLTSVDRIEGIDAAVYIDMGTDTYMDIAADVDINFLTPQLDLSDQAKVINILDASSTSLVISEAGTAYLTFDTTDGSEKIIVGKDMEMGSISFTEDGGAMEAMDMSVSASPAAATEESYSFKIDNEVILKIYAEADSAGGIQNPKVVIGNNVDAPTLEFDGPTADGTLSWIGGSDWFLFSDDIMVSGTERLQFQDNATYIYSSADGQLDLVADTEIQLAATTIDVNGILDVSGNIVCAGTVDGVDVATHAALNVHTAVADTASAGCYVTLFESATGDIAPKTAGALTYNAVTGALTVGLLVTAGTVDGIDISAINLNTMPAAISGDVDFGDYDLTSVDKLEGYDAAVYVDMGADGLIDVTADTSVTFNTPLVVLENGASLANKVNADIDTGAEVVDTFADTAGAGAIWSYVVIKGANVRTGQVMAAWDATGDTITYTETSTADVGDTSGMALTVDIVANAVRLVGTAGSDDWSVEVIRQLI